MGRGGGRGGGGRSSGGGFFSRSSSTSSSSSRSSSTAQAPPKAPSAPTQPQAPPTAVSSGPGLLGTMAQGMAFGAGSEISRQAVRSVMGGSNDAAHPQEGSAGNVAQTQPLCFAENNNFVECLKFNSNDIARCQNLFESVQSCRQGFKF